MTKAIIIGAGIAGLSAGCYLQMNGYKTEIFEMHDKVGGLCTSWKRKGYTIDGCIHWFVGSNPKDPFYKIWNGLVDMKHFPRAEYGEFCSVEEDGKVLRLIGDFDKFEEELISVSPEDTQEIKEMIAGARKISETSLAMDKASEVMSPLDKARMMFKMIPMGLAYNKWKVPIGEYSKKFKSSLIRKLLITPFAPEVPMIVFLMNMGWFHSKTASYPVGGAEELAKRIEERYKSLGGKINLKTKVAKIIVENNCAKGIQLENKETFSADYIISAADGHEAIFDMLEEQYVDENIAKLYYNKRFFPKQSAVYVSFGVARIFDESFKPYVFIPLKKPLNIDGKDINDVGITIHNFDPKAAPEGKTVLTMMIPTFDTDYWVKLRAEDKAGYMKRKAEIAKHMADEIEAHFGNFKEKVEMIDVATPATYIRYTHNWNGAPMGWQDFDLMLKKPKKEINGLKNFFMCGHWVGDAGLPGAAQSGRDIAQILCKRDGREYRSIGF